MSRTYAEIEHQVGRLRRLLDGLDPHSTEPEDVIELRRAGHAVLLDRRAHRRRLGHRGTAPRAALLQLATPDLTAIAPPRPPTTTSPRKTANGAGQPPKLTCGMSENPVERRTNDEASSQLFGLGGI